MDEKRTEAIAEEYPASPATPEEMPRPTYWPVALAFGLTLLFWALVTSPLVAIVGAVVSGTALVGWIRELGHE